MGRHLHHVVHLALLPVEGNKVQSVTLSIVYSENCSVRGASGVFLHSGVFHTGLCNCRSLKHPVVAGCDVYVRRVLVCKRLIA